MFRIINHRGCGKTSQLMTLAKTTNSAIACSNPNAMREKAKAYGLNEINFISYHDLFNKNYQGNVMIDELEIFTQKYLNCPLIGYSLTDED